MCYRRETIFFSTTGTGYSVKKATPEGAQGPGFLFSSVSFSFCEKRAVLGLKTHERRAEGERGRAGASTWPGGPQIYLAREQIARKNGAHTCGTITNKLEGHDN